MSESIIRLSAWSRCLLPQSVHPFVAVGHRDSPAVGLDNFLDDCEPEAGSVAVRCKPRIEDVFAFFLGDARAVVFDVETIIFNSTDPDRHVVAPVFDGVAKQVLKELLETVRIDCESKVIVNDQHRVLVVDHLPTVLNDGCQ